MKENDLKALFKKAAEIAESVPEPLREAAFNRAVDALLGIEGGKTPTKTKKPVETLSKAKERTSERKDEDPLLVDLDRTAHPQIRTAPRVLERSLFLLRIAKDEFHIDGLTSTRIAKVLTEKFRLRTTRQAVQQALDAAGDMVDRVPMSPKGTSYRIMDPGERYLDTGQFDTKAGSIVSKRTLPTKKPKRRKSSKPGKKKKVKDSSVSKTTKRRSVGPKAALKDLISDGYFSSSRRIAEIQSHLQHKKGLFFRVVDLSTPLVRLLREKMIDRTQAEDGQYEYKKA